MWYILIQRCVKISMQSVMNSEIYDFTDTYIFIYIDDVQNNESLLYIY